MASPSSAAIICSNVYPHCAYSVSIGDEDTIINAWLDHVLQEHGMAHAAPPQTSLKVGILFTLSTIYLNIADSITLAENISIIA